MVTALGAVANVNAQEDKSKDKSLNREMTLEREYAPTVQDANKVNTLPLVKEPEAKKVPISYSNFSIAATPEKEFSLLPSGNIMTDMTYNKRRGYLNFGIGNYTNINGDFGYHVLSTDKDILNFWFSHRSTSGNVKYTNSTNSEEKTKAKLNDNIGGMDFKHAFNKLWLNMGIKYNYSAFNYYGYFPDLFENELNKDLSYQGIPDKTTNQVSQALRAHIGVTSKEEKLPVNYLLDFCFTNLEYKYALRKATDGPTERTFTTRFDLNSPFNGSQRIGVSGNMNYFNYNLPQKTDSMKAVYNNHLEAFLTPYYKVEGDNWHLQLGANVMIITGDNDKISASPNISADITVTDKTVLYGLATGHLYSNSLYETSLINRYIDLGGGMVPSRNWLDAKIGIKSSFTSGFWFDLFGGLKKTDDDIFYTPQYNPEYDFIHVSKPFQTKSTQAYGGVNFKYNYQKLVDINIKGIYNYWKVEDPKDVAYTLSEYKAYGKPEMEFTFGATVHPISQITASAEYYLATGRYYLEPYSQKNVKMNNINELDLTGTYTLNDTFGLFLKMNNVLCQKYELYYGYPLQSFNAMIGFNINF